MNAHALKTTLNNQSLSPNKGHKLLHPNIGQIFILSKYRESIISCNIEVITFSPDGSLTAGNTIRITNDTGSTMEGQCGKCKPRLTNKLHSVPSG